MNSQEPVLHSSFKFMLGDTGIHVTFLQNSETSSTSLTAEGKGASWHLPEPENLYTNISFITASCKTKPSTKDIGQGDYQQEEEPLHCSMGFIHLDILFSIQLRMIFHIQFYLSCNLQSNF